MDYHFYEYVYGGTLIDRDSWTYYSGQAEAWIKRIEREYKVRVPGVPCHLEGYSEEDREKYEKMIEDAVGKAVCAIADVICSIDNVASGEGGPVTSAKVGSVSVSYGSARGIDLSSDGQRNMILEAASLYLDIDWGKVMFL